MLEVPCQHCMTPIEFPDEWAQRAIECPSCNQQTFLATVKNEPDSDAARSPKVQFVPPSDAPSPQAAGQGQQHGRVITINEWACNAKNSGAGAAIVGVLVIIIGMKTGIFWGHEEVLVVSAGFVLLSIGLIGYAVVSYAYPTLFCCSFCRNSLKDKSERFCPKCGAELGGEAIGE